ncbi:hypothetical protein [Phormidesmis sp. 146-33]
MTRAERQTTTLATPQQLQNYRGLSIMPRQTWILESDDKDGDFSAIGSQNTYQVGNLTDAVEAESRTIEEGGETVWNDAPIDSRNVYEVESGQKFTIAEFELDSQGVQYQVRD